MSQKKKLIPNSDSAKTKSPSFLNNFFLKCRWIGCDSTATEATSHSFWWMWTIVLTASVACMIAGAVLIGPIVKYNESFWKSECQVLHCSPFNLKMFSYE